MDWIGAVLVLLGFYLFSGGRNLGYVLYIAGEICYAGYAYYAEPRGWGLIFVSFAFIGLGLRDYHLRRQL